MLTDVCTINGWTTDATRYIRIYTPTTERHNGTAATGFRITDNGTGEPMRIVVSFLRIEGLVVKATIDSISGIADVGIPAGVGDIRVSQCIVFTSQAGTATGVGIDFRNVPAAVVIRVWNNIVYDFTNSTVTGYGIGLSSTTAVAY